MIYESSLRILSGLFYGCAFFLSLIGYGFCLTKMLKIKSPFPVGLLACIGIAVIIFLGGIQASLSIVSSYSNIFLVILGCIFCYPILKEYFKNILESKISFDIYFYSFLAVRCTSILVILFHILGSILPHWINGNDDGVSYFVFPKVLIETGSLIEPFSFRKLTTLGGPFYLDTFLYPIFYISSLPFVDIGLGKMLLWLVAIGCWSSEEKTMEIRLKKELLGLLALIASTAILIINHFPVFLPFLLFLAYLFLYYRIVKSKDLMLSEVFLASIVGAAIITFRNNFIVFIFFSSVLFLSCSYKKEKPFYNNLLPFFLCYFSILIFLIPWLILSYQSSETIFFPLFQGNYRFPYAIKAPLDCLEKTLFLCECISYSKILIILLMILPLIFLKNSVNFGFIIFISSFFSLILTALNLTATNEYHVARYCYPFIFSGILVLVSIVVCSVSFLVFKNFFYFFYVLFLSIYSFTIYTDFHINAFVNNTISLFSVDLESFWKEKDFASYRAAQDFLPKKAKCISITEKPFYWDFCKQEIHSIDCIGQASPSPGQPFFQGEMVLAKYFLELGYKYFIYTPFDTPAYNCMYNKNYWDIKKNRTWSVYQNRERFLWKNWAVYFRDFYDSIEKMESLGAIVYQDKYIKIIDIEKVVFISIKK
ncbi:MAG: hypothetical protein HUU50_01970 [Candidatus Brocadiae bacterium]|nr:hypothetical protein [Candidatus Brocadiia bacterium]